MERFGKDNRGTRYVCVRSGAAKYRANQQDIDLVLVSGTISNGVGRVKSFLISFLLCLGTPLDLRRTALVFDAAVDCSCPCPTYSLGPCHFINSVLPTSHLFGH